MYNGSLRDMPTEKDFETALAKYPELIEEGLQLIGRQMTMYGRRMDLVFSDRFQRTLIAELKWGPIKDTHIGQIMAYEGILLSSTDPSIRVMLIGTRVPPNLRNSLDHHGIAWKEIKQTDLTSFLGSKCDHDLLRVFEEATVSPLAFPQKQSGVHSSLTEATPKMEQVADDQAGGSGDSFEKALRKCANPNERRFFETAQARKQARVTYAVRYDDASGRLRWYVKPQIQEAYVVQKGRFAGDEDFWRSRLSRPAEVGPKRKTDGDADLRFHLVTAADFESFQEVADREARDRTLDWEPFRRRRKG